MHTQKGVKLVTTNPTTANSPVTVASTYSADNQIAQAVQTSPQAPTQTITYAEDGNGSLIQTANPAAGTTAYAYDFERRLTKVGLPNGTTVQFAYDPDGLRVQKTGTSGVVIYAHCPCRPETGPPRYGAMANPIASPIVTIDAASLAALTARVAEPATRAASGQPVTTQIHLTADGGRFASASHLSADGNAGTVHLRGNIGPIPFDLDLTVTLDLAAQLHVAQSIPFDHQWTYQLEGGHATTAGLFATALAPAPAPAPPAPTLSPSYWCMVGCGGTTILGLLVKCLPGLAAGSGGYIACVTAQAGAAAAGIANCIAEDCLR